MRKLFLTLGVLIGNDALAQSCIPVPDCAAMGYTETSCSGNFLRCPFDTTKMACLDKKSSSSSGCEVGMIYYSDGVCSSLYNSKKSIAGIVVEKDKLVMSVPHGTTVWAGSFVDVDGINVTLGDAAKADMNGKENTAAIVSAYPSDTSSNNPAIYCNSYTGGVVGTEGKWYLPAAGELYAYVHGYTSVIEPIVTNTLGWQSYRYNIYWSSSEYSAESSWVVRVTRNEYVSTNRKNNYDGSIDYYDTYYFVCFLEI